MSTVILALVALAPSRQAASSPTATSVLKQWLSFVVVRRPSKERAPDKAIVETQPFLGKRGLHPLRSGNWLIVDQSGGAILVFDEVSSFVNIAALPGALRAIDKLPTSLIHSMADLPQATREYIRRSCATKMPYNAFPADEGFRKLNAMFRPTQSVTIQSGGQSFKIEYTNNDPNLDPITKTRSERQAYWDPLNRTAVPLGMTHDQIVKSMEQDVASKAFFGEGLAFQMAKQSPRFETVEDAIADAFESYQKTVRASRAEAAEAAKRLQAQIRDRFPELNNGYEAGKSVSSLSKEDRDRLRDTLKSQHLVGLTADEDLDRFLEGATISSSEVGLKMGIAIEPSKSILSTILWPR